MKKLPLYAVAVWLAFAANPACHGSDNRWNGTWKLNKLKGHTGDEAPLRISRFYSESGGNPVTRSYGATPKRTMLYLGPDGDYEFTCDGKPSDVRGGRSITCVSTGDRAFDFTLTANGKTLSKCHRSVSADGQKLTERCVKTNANGSQTTVDKEYVSFGRTDDGSLVGDWRNSPDPAEVHTLTFRAQGDSIRIESVPEKTVFEGKLTGDFVPVSGPGVAAGTTESVRQSGPNALAVSIKLNGNVIRNATLNVSPDGRVITEQIWYPGNSLLIWEKQ